jgi:hypothetical protein
MRISHRHRFIFFSSPKTGSESIRVLLDPISDFHGALAPTLSQPFHDHMRPIEAREAFRSQGWDYSSYYSFVFVRNPWTRLVSLYAMILHLDPLMRLPFIEWLETTSPHGTGGGGTSTWRKYGTYSLAAFAGGGSSALFVDDVFRLEDIESVPEKLRRHGVPLPADAAAPHINRTGGTVDYRRFYATKRSVDFVGDNYADEIRRFRYKFPP